jgi:hypothetical protein
MEPFVRAPKTLLSGRGGSQLEGKMEPFVRAPKTLLSGSNRLLALGAGWEILNSVF